MADWLKSIGSEPFVGTFMARGYPGCNTIPFVSPRLEISFQTQF